MAETNAYLKYRLKNLPKPTVVQKVYVGTKYVYALQLYHQNRDAVISRVRKNRVKNGYDLNFRHAKKMYLKNFGHGQALEYFKHNGIDYWWVVTKPNVVDYPDIKWGTQLARIRFKPNRERRTRYRGNVAVTRLVMLNHATPTGELYGQLKRVEVALSPDKQTLLIAAIDVENKAHFSLYDNRKLNDALDGVDDHNGYVDLSQAGDLFSTQVANPYFEIPKFANQLTSPSIQGFDLDNRFAIYVSSGQAAVSENHPSVDTPGISRFQWRSQTAQQVLLHHSNWIGRNIETEGIQVASRVYVGIAYHDAEPYATKTLENRVYWFSNI